MIKIMWLSAWDSLRINQSFFRRNNFRKFWKEKIHGKKSLSFGAWLHICLIRWINLKTREVICSTRVSTTISFIHAFSMFWKKLIIVIFLTLRSSQNLSQLFLVLKNSCSIERKAFFFYVSRSSFRLIL